MRIFVTDLTLYTYDNEYRAVLNREEVEKFALAFNYAKGKGGLDRIYIFSDYRREDFEKALASLSDEERGAFENLVLSPLDFEKKNGVTLKFHPVNLMDFEDTYGEVMRTLENILETDGKVEVYVNLSCGHKIGALATYIATVNIRDECKRNPDKDCKKDPCKDIVVYPYHAEVEVVQFPAIGVEPRYADLEYEKYLEIFSTPVSYEEAKQRMSADDREVDKVFVYLLKKRGLIVKRKEDGKYGLSTRGRTLLYLLRSLGQS